MDCTHKFLDFGEITLHFLLFWESPQLGLYDGELSSIYSDSDNAIIYSQFSLSLEDDASEDDISIIGGSSTTDWCD